MAPTGRNFVQSSVCRLFCKKTKEDSLHDWVRVPMKSVSTMCRLAHEAHFRVPHKWSESFINFIFLSSPVKNQSVQNEKLVQWIKHLQLPVWADFLQSHSEKYFRMNERFGSFAWDLKVSPTRWPVHDRYNSVSTRRRVKSFGYVWRSNQKKGKDLWCGIMSRMESFLQRPSRTRFYGREMSKNFFCFLDEPDVQELIYAFGKPGCISWREQIRTQIFMTGRCTWTPHCCVRLTRMRRPHKSGRA